MKGSALVLLELLVLVLLEPGIAFRFLFSNGGLMIVYVERRRYGCLSFLGDIIMLFLTCGLWLIWIFVREMRNRSPY